MSSTPLQPWTSSTDSDIVRPLRRMADPRPFVRRALRQNQTNNLEPRRPSPYADSLESRAHYNRLVGRMVIEDFHNNLHSSRNSWSNFDSEWLEIMFDGTVTSSRRNRDYELVRNLANLTEIFECPLVDCLEIPSQNEV